jgi:outer membrane lipoprotein SlyB
VYSKKQGTFKGEANLAVKLTRLEVHGKGYMIASSTYADTQKGKGKRTAVATGGGAAVGALIGGLAGGGKGAAIGAGLGAGGGLAVSGATGGKNVEFPAESRITFKLEDAVTIDR